eukprot:1819350-Karenia_brevis.AAC.1
MTSPIPSAPCQHCCVEALAFTVMSSMPVIGCQLLSTLAVCSPPTAGLALFDAPPRHWSSLRSELLLP